MFQKLAILAFVAVGVLAVTVPQVPRAKVRLEGTVQAESDSLLTCFFDATYPTDDSMGMTQWAPEVAFWFNNVLLGEYKGKSQITHHMMLDSIGND